MCMCMSLIFFKGILVQVCYPERGRTYSKKLSSSETKCLQGSKIIASEFGQKRSFRGFRPVSVPLKTTLPTFDCRT